MSRRLRDVVTRRGRETFAGRRDELAALLELLDSGGPLVAYVHGLAGMGKSALLEAFSVAAHKRGARVVRLDCRTVEPTPRGFIRELARAVGSRSTNLDAVATMLGRFRGTAVVVLDTVEVLRLLDAWLRQILIPALQDNTRVVMASREAPVPTWRTAAGWQGLVRVLALGPLGDADAVALVRRTGISLDAARRINQFARGHPLALMLGSAVITERPDLDLEQAALPRVVEQLTRVYLAEAPDPLTREALEAAAVIRRVTRPLLRSMLPGQNHVSSFDRVRLLPFVEAAADGLIVHNAVQQAITTSLRSTDPDRYRTFKRAAWQHLSGELTTVGPNDYWRCTADLLYLLENPNVREGFFPSAGPAPLLEPAQASDGAAIAMIAERHEGDSAQHALRVWWTRVPHAFRVVRGRDGIVKAFYCVLEAHHVGAMLLRHDPLVRRWHECLAADPLPAGQRALLLRRWLDRQAGERPSPEQGACWLDVKRRYLELRPFLRRVYTAVCDPSPYLAAVEKLGFVAFPRATVRLDGRKYHSVMLDMGPASVDGWLAGLLSAELGSEAVPTLDPESREIVIGQRRLSLGPREWGVLAYLWQRPHRIVDHATLLEQVWGANGHGSNVLEVTMRGLRQKLGKNAALIQTVRGRGYRLIRI